MGLLWWLYLNEKSGEILTFFINTLYNNKCISMIFLHGLSTNDELYKHYIGGDIADAIVVGGTTYTFSGLDTDNGYGYLWVNGNDIIVSDNRTPYEGMTVWNTSTQTSASVNSVVINNYESTYAEPWTSFTPGRGVVYNKYHCDFGGYTEFVDLGFESGTLWATCNLGASSPSEFGDFYQWGDGGYEPYQYNWTYCPWCWETNNVMTAHKYNADDGKVRLDKDDDSAYKLLGGGWHIPTTDQLQELMYGCEINYDSTNHIIVFTSYGNGNQITFPMSASGCVKWDSSLVSATANKLILLTNEIYTYYKDYLTPRIYYWDENDNYITWQTIDSSWHNRAAGYQIRPVIDSGFNPYTILHDPNTHMCGAAR